MTLAQNIQEETKKSGSLDIMNLDFKVIHNPKRKFTLKELSMYKK